MSASKKPIRIASCSPHIAARASAGRWTVGAEKISYHYNGGSDRVHKLRNLTREEVLHDESGKRLHSFVQSTSGFGTNAFREYVYLDDVPVATIDPAGIAYLETDHLGTPRVAADPATNAWRWRWNFFGTAFGEHAPTVPASGALALDLRYPGQAYDAETGLHYNYFRDYESSTGRYTQSDPVGLLGGVSTYTYVRNGPLRRADSVGLWSAVDYYLWDYCRKGLGGFVDISAWCKDYLLDPSVSAIIDKMKSRAKRKAHDLLGFVGSYRWTYEEHHSLYVTSIYSFGMGNGHEFEIDCIFSGDGCCVTGKCGLSAKAKDYFKDPFDLNQYLGLPPSFSDSAGRPFWFGLSCSGGSFSVSVCKN